MIYIYPTNIGRLICVDDDMAHLSLERFHVTSHGYAKDSRGVYVHHRVIGTPPDGQVVDHINRCKLDNRRCNLRFISNAENIANAGARKHNKSGFKGVYWNGRRWQVTGSRNRRTVYLGTYAELSDASDAYRTWEQCTVAAMSDPF